MVVASEPVDLKELKSRHPLGDTVEAAGVRLRGKGRVRQGICPFHEEAEGSFTVYADSERWFCFGCGLGGDVMDFIRRTQGLSLPEAIRRLDGPPDSRAGGPGLPTRAVVQSRAAVGPRRNSTTVVLPPRDPALLTAAARFYAGQLRRNPPAQSGAGSAAREYLASRGIGIDVAVRLGLGYAPGHGLRQALDSAGFDGARLRASGLFMEGGRERFTGMVTVPDMAVGRVRWLTGRAIAPNVTPRFQAVPGPKPALGLGRLGPSPPWAVLTEGVFDWLTLAGWGYPACAALGTQGLERVAEALRGCPHIFLAFDDDGAGRTATVNLQTLLGRRTAVVNLPEGVADVGDLATLPHGRSLFQRLLAKAARAAR